MFCYFPLRGSVFLAVGASFWKGVIVQMKTGIEKWREMDGDNTLALDWELTEDSHVWEIGGFEGRWAQQIWDKFHCHITIFEPQLWAFDKMKKRFEGIDKIEIHPYGLWTRDEVLPIGGHDTDGAGIYSDRNPVKVVMFRDFYKEISGFRKPIDLALMNIEGMEYDLLPRFVGSGVMERFDYFWCQFHPGLTGDKGELSAEIFNGIERTHRRLWDCYPTAVAWRRK